MPGSVLELLVESGQEVAKGQTIMVLEAMKMEHRIAAPTDGVVDSLPVAVGAQVQAGETLAVII